ncbi:MAG: CbtA family protein [Gammaproteobacteria bacterium]|nr:CbtA family protein [Gammaproteobacteria bacterium]
MEIFRRLVFCAVIAGCGAGVAVTVLHQWLTVPLILRAETYESAASKVVPADHAATAHEHVWRPAEGLERVSATAIADVLTGIGFALLLCAIWTVRRLSMNWRRGALWGVGGFVTITLAPSLGLPPELPGAAAADLTARQLWWLATVSITATALGVFAVAKNWQIKIAALLFVLLPQLAGAPLPLDAASRVPAALSIQFTRAVLVSSFCFWVMLGALTGFVYKGIDDE